MDREEGIVIGGVELGATEADGSVGVGMDTGNAVEFAAILSVVAS